MSVNRNWLVPLRPHVEDSLQRGNIWIEPICIVPLELKGRGWRVQFPAPTLDSSQRPVTPTPGMRCPLASEGACSRVHTPNTDTRNAHNKKPV